MGQTGVPQRLGDQTVGSFAAPWDRRLQIATATVCLLPLCLAVVMPPTPAWMWAIKAAMLLAVLSTWTWAPQGYRVEPNCVVVRRPVGELRIPLATTCHARLVAADELRGTIRIWGVGGLFGYFGRFLNGTESQRWYVTDLSRCVRLECAGKVIILSPSDPAAFLAALRNTLTSSAPKS